MAEETQTKTPARKEEKEKTVGATGNPTATPRVGEPDATYVDPDLSFQDNVGELPADEKAWNEARDAAREEGVEAADAAEAEATKERQKVLDEEAAENEKLQDVRAKVAAAKATGAQPIVNVDLPK